jgi:hypothetical protein
MAHVGGWPQEDDGYEISGTPFENRAYVRYYSNEYYTDRADQKAAEQRKEPHYWFKDYGEIEIKTVAWDAYSANTGKWLFIVQDAGKKEIYRSRGLDMNWDGKESSYYVNRYINGTSTIYRGRHSIGLKEAVDFPLYLSIINPGGDIIEYTIDRN